MRKTKVILIATLAVSLMCFWGCDSNEPCSCVDEVGVAQRELLGSWEFYDEYIYYEYTDYRRETLTFSSDGKFEMKMERYYDDYQETDVNIMRGTYKIASSSTIMVHTTYDDYYEDPTVDEWGVGIFVISNDSAGKFLLLVNRKYYKKY